MAEALDRLCGDLDAPIEEVMAQAVALLMLAVGGQKRGFGIGLIDEESNVVEEIVNFGIPEEREDAESSLSVGSTGPDS